MRAYRYDHPQGCPRLAPFPFKVINFPVDGQWLLVQPCLFSLQGVSGWPQYRSGLECPHGSCDSFVTRSTVIKGEILSTNSWQIADRLILPMAHC